MDEAVLERIRKDETDRQWNEFHDEETKTNGRREPSPRQKTYIVALAKTVGLKVNVSSIRDREKASRFIEKLKTLSRQMNGNSYELRDKRVAFGMATKLVFKKYLDRNKEYRKSKKFWKEVEELYWEYQTHFEFVVEAGNHSQL